MERPCTLLHSRYALWNFPLSPTQATKQQYLRVPHPCRLRVGSYDRMPRNFRSPRLCEPPRSLLVLSESGEGRSPSSQILFISLCPQLTTSSPSRAPPAPPQPPKSASGK